MGWTGLPRLGVGLALGLGLLAGQPAGAKAQVEVSGASSEPTRVESSADLGIRALEPRAVMLPGSAQREAFRPVSAASAVGAGAPAAVGTVPAAGTASVASMELGPSAPSTPSARSAGVGRWLMAGGGALLAAALGEHLADGASFGLSGRDAALYGAGLTLFGIGAWSSARPEPEVLAGDGSRR